MKEIRSIDALSPVSQIGESSFNRCISLQQMVIPHSVYKIVPCCFKCCSSLVQIQLSQFLPSIEAYTFEECISLIQKIITSLVLSIKSGAFRNFASLVNVEFEENSSLEKVYYSSFEKCSSLEQICKKLIWNNTLCE